MVPLKQHNIQWRITLEILKQCSSNLAPAMSITKETKWHPSYNCHDNSYAAGSAWITTKIPRFYLKQGSSTSTNLMGRVKTIWEPCEHSEQDPLGYFKKVANGDIWFFTDRDWDIVGIIMLLLWCALLVPSLKNTALMFLELFSIECCANLVEPPMTSSLLIKKNVNIYKTKKYF